MHDTRVLLFSPAAAVASSHPSPSLRSGLPHIRSYPPDLFNSDAKYGCGVVDLAVVYYLGYFKNI